MMMIIMIYDQMIMIMIIFQRQRLTEAKTWKTNTEKVYN